MIDETYAMYIYKTEDGIPQFLTGKTIVLMYPDKDTILEDGTLDGYYQNLFFKMIVFNCEEPMKMYKPNKLYDAIFTDEVNVVNLTVFKDGAFCTTMEGNIGFLDGQAATFYRRDKYEPSI